MFPRRYSPPSLFGSTLRLFARHLSHQRGRRVRWGKQRRDAVGIGSQELGFAAVGFLEQLTVRETADQPGVNDAGPTHARDVTRACVNAMEIPDRFARVRVVVDQKTAAVFFGKDPGKPPR